MPFAQANGQKLYYEQHGEGEPLLCVMGLGADHLSWMLQVPAFSQRHRTIIFDNRDVGQSTYATEQYEIADMADDAIALADELGLDTFHLLGVSMGGAISQEIALKVPDRIRTLTLVVTWPGAGAAGLAQAKMLGEDAVRLTTEQQVERMLVYTLSEEYFDRPGAVEMARNILLANPHLQKPDGFARQADASGRHETRDRLPSLQMPVHVIGAEHDMLVPVWKSKQVAELIPGAKLSIIPRAAHGVQLERSDEFNALVLDFIGAQLGAGASA